VAQATANILACFEVLLEAGSDPEVKNDMGCSVREVVLSRALHEKKL
jgi:hypothetical protein